MKAIDNIFDRLDSWRNLPNYQLERRADIFFALYLPMVLERKFDVSLKPLIIPEFPVRIGTVSPGIQTNKSFKIDYLLLANDYSEAFMVELKTDQSSRRRKQDDYLDDAANIGMTELIQGLVRIFQATDSKRKYHHLFKLLEEIGVVNVPTELEKIVYSNNKVGIKSLIQEIEIIKHISKCRVVYLQPSGSSENIITFEEFSNIIGEMGDHFSNRFSKSLRKWASTRAGDLGI